MLRLLLALAIFVTATIGQPAYADRKQKEAAKATAYAQAVLDQFGGTGDELTLFNADRVIERAWREYTHFHNMESEIGRELALLRAKSASARKEKKRVAEAWAVAIQLQPVNISLERRMALSIQAANALAASGDFAASRQYFSAARTYAFAQDRDTKMLQLQLRIQELRALGPQMEWRPLRDTLLDMRTFSEGFSMWTIPRLDALISEAELRLALQPESDEKRVELGELKSKIELMMKGMGNLLSPQFVNRVRSFYYTIEDVYDL